MATRTETRVVYLAGLVQGIVLVTFPAASTIFTNPQQYDLSRTQYGTLFLPQVVLAITTSLLGGVLAARLSTKRTYLIGLASSLTSMALLVISSLFTTNHSFAYGLLVVATGFLGAGFGLTAPALNTLTAAFHPTRVDKSVLTLNALLGLGTALAPVFVAVFVGLGFWWALPVLSAIMLIALVTVSLRLPLRTRSGGTASPRGGRRPIPARIALFAALAILYGLCETMNGNWAQLDMTQQVEASATWASVALATFWAMVTVGRVLFAAIQKWFPTRRTYRILPFWLAASLALVAALPTGSPGLGVLAFGLAGFGCSALLPLTISFGQEQLVAISASMSGIVIAFYQLGFGIAAFGAGPLQDAGISLPTLFAATAIAAGVMGLLSFAVTGRRVSPETRTHGHRPAS